MITFIVADDHPFTLMGTKFYVEQLGYKVIGTYSNGLAAHHSITIQKPTIAILDIEMPGLSGIEILEKLHKEQSKTKVIFVTMHKEYSIFKKAMEYKLAGYLVKEKAPEELGRCILHVLEGKHYLSDSIKDDLIVGYSDSGELASLISMEKRIVDLIAEQKTNKQIADYFFVSEKMIEKHRSKIIEKLGLPKEKNVLLKWAMNRLSQ